MRTRNPGALRQRSLMDEISFLQDLAVVMIVAGLVTIVFHRFKQPVVLGYILAGLIIGPHTPGPIIHDEHTIKTLAWAWASSCSCSPSAWSSACAN